MAPNGSLLAAGAGAGWGAGELSIAPNGSLLAAGAGAGWGAGMPEL